MVISTLLKHSLESYMESVFSRFSGFVQTLETNEVLEQRKNHGTFMGVMQLKHV